MLNTAKDCKGPQRLHRTSRKTTKDCRRTATDLREDHTGSQKLQGHLIRCHSRGLTWRVSDWCYPRC